MKRIVPILLILLMLPVFSVSAGDEGKLMQSGDKGEEVVRVQTRLFDLGYYTYKPTGAFRTVTKTAVVAYQAASGLMSDGSVGQETATALFLRSAKRADYHAEIPLTYTAQGAITEKGNTILWATVRPMLVAETAYRVKNAATGEVMQLIFASGENHAEMKLPTRYADAQNAGKTLNKWLGSTNSFYKCTVLFELDGQWIAASMQWNGENRVCLYFKGSTSHVLNMPDVEHEMNIKKAGN